MENNRILLALKGQDEIKAFSGFLSGMGFDCIPAPDGAHALELAIQEEPSVIVTCADLPVIGGERLFQILRNNPHTSRIPFLFVGDGVTDIKGFRTGVDIFLIRPVSMEETHARIRRSISAGTATASKEIEGRLSHMSLADLLQFLHLNKKEGELKVTSGGRSGSVLIKDGNIHNAMLDGAESEKALFRLLNWTDGKFEFMPKTIAAPRKVKSSTGNLLMEGMRQIDEFKKKEDQFPPPGSALKLKVDPSALPKGLQPIIYEVIGLVKERPRVGDVVDRSHYPDYEVYQTICSLAAKGVLEEVKKPGEELRQEFLTADQMISIREKLMGRFPDIADFNYGKILVLSTSGELAADFMKACRKIPGFALNARSAFPEISVMNPLGETGSFRIYGGMEIALFSVPTVTAMGPIWRAFSAGLAGLIILMDEAGSAFVKELSAAKTDILLRRRVPVAHAYIGGLNEDACRKALNMRPDENMFRLDPSERETAYELFYYLFGALIREDGVPI